MTEYFSEWMTCPSLLQRLNTLRMRDVTLNWMTHDKFDGVHFIEHVAYQNATVLESTIIQIEQMSQCSRNNLLFQYVYSF